MPEGVQVSTGCGIARAARGQGQANVVGEALPERVLSCSLYLSGCGGRSARFWRRMLEQGPPDNLSPPSQTASWPPGQLPHSYLMGTNNPCADLVQAILPFVTLYATL